MLKCVYNNVLPEGFILKEETSHSHENLNKGTDICTSILWFEKKDVQDL